MEKTRAERRNEDIPIEASFNIIKTSNKLDQGFNAILKPCLKFIKKKSDDQKTYLATKAIGLLAIKIARGEYSKELLNKIVSIFSSIKSEDVTTQMLGCLAITTLAGATQFSEIEISMKTIWQFICTYSNYKLKSRKNWASVMSSAISVWSLLLTRIDTEKLIVLTNWETGVMTRLLDMLKEENCIKVACVEALAIICEKGCFEPFSSEDYDNWTMEWWKDEIREQVTPVCGWKSDVSKFFEVNGAVQTSKTILYGKITLKSWSQWKKIVFIEEFFEDEFTLQMMENKFIQDLFELGPNVRSFGPKLYEPIYDEVEDKGSLQNIRNFGGKTRILMTSRVQKDRSILQRQQRLAKTAKCFPID